jgi:hypothetical protein
MSLMAELQRQMDRYRTLAHAEPAEPTDDDTITS